MLDGNMNAARQPPSEASFDGEGLTFQASQLDVGECAEALRGNGTALMRGVVPQDLFPPMINDVEGYFRWLTNGERIQEASLYASYGNIFFATVADFGERALMELVYHVTRAPMSEALYAFFGTDRVSLFLGYSFIRRHWRTDVRSISPFHQDSEAVPVPAPMLTCWIPFNTCGVHAPGLEVVAARVNAALPITDSPATNHARTEIDASVVKRHFGDRLWHPEFDAGDAMLFDSKCVHRTHVTPVMSGVRYSVELRFVDVSLAPPEWIDKQGDLLITIPRRPQGQAIRTPRR